MKTVLIIALACISSLVFSQEDKNPKNGKVTLYYPIENGLKTIQATGLNKRSHPIGTWQFYTPNGILDYTIDYQDKAAVKKTYIGNLIISEENFTNDTLNGTQTYYNDQSQKVVQGHYTKGHLDSLEQYYTETNTMFSRYVFYENLKVKKREEFFPTGELKSVKNYNKSGALDGNFEVYEMNRLGIYLIRKEVYKNGHLNGPVIKGYKNNITSEANYINGVRHGVYTEYYEYPQQAYSVEFVNGIETGKGVRYFPNGNVSEEKYWPREKGKYTAHVYDSCFIYWENGNIQSKLYNSQLNKLQIELRIIEFYPNEKVKLERTEVNGAFNGVKKIYYESGTLQGEVAYKLGTIDGKMMFWHENGKKQIELIVKNDTVISQKVWDKSGRIVPKNKLENNELLIPIQYYDQQLKNPFVKNVDWKVIPVQEHLFEDNKTEFTSAKSFITEKQDEFINRVKRRPEIITSLNQSVSAQVNYTVESNGTISQVKLVLLNANSYDFFFPLLEMEAKRIFSLMSFTPAIANRKNVAQKLSLIILF